jgi:ligand-binding sensor domain-containing protein
MYIKFISKLFSLLTIISVVHLPAQLPEKAGAWTTYLPQREGNWVTQSKEKIYYSTGRSVLGIDKAEGAVTEITRQDGLSETLIEKIAYDNFNQQLIIGYKSGNIDVVTQKGIINLPYIKENQTLTGQKTINDISVVNENYCYLSTNFGIIEWDLKKQEFRTTIFTDQPVLAVRLLNNKLVAATQDGLFTVDQNDLLKVNFNRWQLLGGRNGLKALYNFNAMAAKGNKLFAGVDNEIYESSDGQNFTKISNIIPPENYAIKYISGEGKHLIIGYRDKGFNTITYAVSDDKTILPAGGGCSNLALYGIEDEQNRLWFADEWRAIRHTTRGLNDGCEFTEYPSPFSHTTSDIAIKKDKIFFASGGASEDLALLSVRSGIYILDSNRWTNLTGAFNPELDRSDYHNFFGIDVHPQKDELYAASYFSGIMKYDFKTGKLTFFNRSNAPLTGSVPWVADVKFDKNSTMWATHTNADRPLIALTKDSTWFTFKPPITSTKIGRIAIDQRGYKWIQVAGTPGGVLVFHEGEKIQDPTDDRYKYFDLNNSEIKGNKVYSIKADLDGRVWVGTSQGPVIFDCNPFDDRCRGAIRRVTQDGVVGLLLSNEEILSIEADGGNRKWFGTRNGIFVQSPDGSEQIMHLTTENAPLLDNQIYTMKFDGKTGVMFIGTIQGLQSYQTETFGAEKAHSSDVYTFPNPVRPGYEGPISVRGLGRDAIVKITDINGVLVFQTKALGGQANWDGRDYTGRRAAPGVYLVFSTSQLSFESSDSYVTKFLIIGN